MRAKLKETPWRMVLLAVLPEFLFALLPMLVVAIVLLYSGRSVHHIFASPEWSFSTAVLFGQTVVRFVAGVAHAGRANAAVVAVSVAILLVLGLVPSLVILALVLHAHETAETSTALIISQLALFLWGSIAFFIFGGVGEAIHEDRDAKHGTAA